jgi:Mn-dependent DtxR family transcriptional regulator
MDKNEQKEAAAMHIQESGEMYLESIYVLSQTGKPVRSVDVSEYLGYSKPSVSRAMGILKKESLITINPSGHIALTDKGREIAESMYERHTLISSFLESLGVNSDIAAEDACRIEHVISDETFEAIRRHGEKNAK